MCLWTHGGISNLAQHRLLKLLLRSMCSAYSAQNCVLPSYRPLRIRCKDPAYSAQCMHTVLSLTSAYPLNVCIPSSHLRQRIRSMYAYRPLTYVSVSALVAQRSPPKLPNIFVAPVLARAQARSRCVFLLSSRWMGVGLASKPSMAIM